MSDGEADASVCELSDIESGSEAQGQRGAENLGRRHFTAVESIDLGGMKTHNDISDDYTIQDVLLHNQLQAAKQRVQLMVAFHAGMQQMRDTRVNQPVNMQFDSSALGVVAVAAGKTFLNKKVEAGGIGAAYKVSHEERRREVIKPVCLQEGINITSSHQAHVDALKVVNACLRRLARKSNAHTRKHP